MNKKIIVMGLMVSVMLVIGVGCSKKATTPQNDMPKTTTEQTKKEEVKNNEPKGIEVEPGVIKDESENQIILYVDGKAKAVAAKQDYAEYRLGSEFDKALEKQYSFDAAAIKQSIKEEVAYLYLSNEQYQKDEEKKPEKETVVYVQEDFLKSHPMSVIEDYWFMKNKEQITFQYLKTDITSPTTVEFVVAPQTDKATTFKKLTLELQKDNTFKVINEQIAQ